MTGPRGARQGTLFARRPSRPPSVRSAREGYSAANLESATIIASNPVEYPPGGLMQEWADMVLSRAAQPQDAAAGPLFAGRAA